MRTCKNTSGRNTRLQLSWLAAVTFLLLAGLFYRSESARLNFIVNNPVRLPCPLSTLPFVIGQWSGHETPIPQMVRETAANDDSVSRLYTNKSTGQWAQVYVGFSGRPRTMIGHKPSVCYVASGWVLDNSEQAQIVCRNGGKIPCLIHRFHRPDSAHSEIVVLNFYVLNGKLSSNESVFCGIEWRTPNIAGDPARYVAQIQMSSTLEAFVLAAAADLSETIIEFFPDSNGVAAQRAGIVGGIKR